jgi:hypothetical protein
MKYKIKNDWFKKRIKSLKRYTSKQEMDVLLLEDSATLIDVAKILTDVEPLNEYDAGALILKLRELSVSDVIEVTVACGHCDFMNLYEIEINEFFDFKITGKFPQGVFEDLNEITDADDMILKTYNKLNKELQDQTRKFFKLTTKRVCKRCGKDIDIAINPKDTVSKSSPTKIFKEYLDISFYTHNSKLDIDSMYPFQREITISLINEKIKEQGS